MLLYAETCSPLAVNLHALHLRTLVQRVGDFQSRGSLQSQLCSCWAW
jgi:hypothetical protein